MQTMQAVIVGVVQGLSEFLPISSSAHIVFASAIYKLVTGIPLPDIASSEEVFFDISLHFATLLAVLLFFKNEIIQIIKGFFIGLKDKNFREPNFKMSIYIILATFITAVLALLFKDIAHFLVGSPKIVSCLLVVTGFILFFSEKFKKQSTSPVPTPENEICDTGLNKFDFKSVILIGLAQGLAVFPGLSRSGLTIASAIFQGIDRVSAAKFSFLISIPIIILASAIYPLLELDFSQIQTFNFKAIIFGMITAFISGYLCIKYFMRFLAKSTLKSFAYYCWVVGVLMFALFSLCHRL